MPVHLLTHSNMHKTKTHAPTSDTQTHVGGLFAHTATGDFLKIVSKNVLFYFTLYSVFLIYRDNI